VIPDSETLEQALRRCARAGDRTRLRRFALGCAKAVMADRDPSPLWTEAVELIEALVSGALVEAEFRRQAALLECQFPLLVALTGLRNGDPRAAAALVVSAALNEDALEAALGASRNERLHARLLAASQAEQMTAERRSSQLVGARVSCRPDDVAYYCLQRQAVRLKALKP
jgi:hypothetical protein